MARTGAKYSALNGTKLEYSATENGTYAQIYGLKTLPDIGGEPATIDTTDLDNTEYETAILGLKPVQSYNFDFNLEDPDVTANITIVNNMENSGNEYYFKLTYSNGIVVSFSSKVRTTITGGSTGELAGFTMHVSPTGEPVRTIPASTSL